MPELKMPQLNSVILSGRLLRDPELKYSGEGKAYIKTGLAVDDGFGDKRTTSFLDIAIFGERAERIHPELSKGVPVYVQGRLRVEDREDKNGVKRRNVTVMCDVITRLTWPDKKEYQIDEKTPPQATQTPAAEPEDDLPF